MSLLTIETQTVQPRVSSWNRQTYQRLKLALSLGLRRQIFVAVCDDLSLRNFLAAGLDAELGSHRLATLNLKTSNPNLIAQIAKWEASHHNTGYSNLTSPAFQILGIELLTRQPPSVQRSFLRHLQAIERSLPLEHGLLLWLPHPWFNTIQQSAPEFWRWHTGIFEFEGEPTPVSPIGPESIVDRPESRSSGKRKRHTRSTNNELRASRQELSTNTDKQNASQLGELLEDAAPANATFAETDEKLHPQGNREQEKSNFQFPIPNEVSAINSDTDASQLEAYLSLGNYYRDRIEQGDVTAENLTIAIQAYEQALQNLPSGETTLLQPQTADILNDIGNLYWMLSRTPAGAESEQARETLSCLEKAIEAYQLAQTKITAETAPQSYAMIQNNLGAAYGDLARFYEPEKSYSRSIRAYQEALRYRSAEVEPLKYASTQNNLGTAYWHLAQYQDAVTNLKNAIAAYTEAVSYYNQEQDSLNWAMIQNNLGTTYWNLAQYEQPVTFLEMAIAAYQNSLKYRTQEVVPAACAATQNNLGTAYWHLASQLESLSATSFPPQTRMEYLQMCVSAYENAIALGLQLATNTPPVPVNFDLYATCNNLGLVHFQLATDLHFSLAKAEKSDHLEAALHLHLQALQGSVAQSDGYQSTLLYIIKTIRAFYRECGLQGQNLALSKVPGQLLPEIIPRL